jgi:hypothetical protein
MGQDDQIKVLRQELTIAQEDIRNLVEAVDRLSGYIAGLEAFIAGTGHIVQRPYLDVIKRHASSTDGSSGD